MRGLEDGLLLFHGSYIEVPQIDLTKCLPGKDFGRGFYLTTDYSQAVNFVHLSAKKHAIETGQTGMTGGFISSYKLNEHGVLSFCSFDDADKNWLHFVSANRRQGLFPEMIEEYESYDVIAGKIANDRTARTLQLYVSGAFGEPGSESADRIAIETLLPNRLADQYCFRTSQAISQLEFLGSDFIE